MKGTTQVALRDCVAQHQEALIDLACQLINTPSPSPPGQEREAALVAERRF